MAEQDYSLGMNFDATQVTPQATSELLPAGTHDAVIKDAKWNEAHTSLMLIYSGITMRGEATMGLNLGHENPEYRRYAQQSLSAICHVTGVYNVSDIRSVFNIPIKIKVVNDGQYANVKGHFDAHGNPPGKTGAQPPAAPAPMQKAAPAQQYAQQQFAPQPSQAGSVQPQPQNDAAWNYSPVPQQQPPQFAAPAPQPQQPQFAQQPPAQQQMPQQTAPQQQPAQGFQQSNLPPVAPWNAR
jgi:hypothetical protein